MKDQGPILKMDWPYTFVLGVLSLMRFPYVLVVHAVLFVLYIWNKKFGLCCSSQQWQNKVGNVCYLLCDAHERTWDDWDCKDCLLKRQQGINHGVTSSSLPSGDVSEVN